MNRADWKLVMAWTAMFTIFGTESVRAGTDAWTSIGPQGGGITALSIDPHNPGMLYAATEYGGTFKSLDGGASWAISSGPNSPLIFDPHDPDTIYAVQRWHPRGISKSADGGLSWNPADSGLPPFVEPLVLAIDPLNPSTLYAGTSQGIFKSTDGGTNWSSASSGLPLLDSFPGQPGPPHPTSVYSLVIDPQNPRTVYAVADGLAFTSGTGVTVISPGGLFKSTDGGGSWNSISLGLPESHTIAARLAIDPQNPSTLYVGTVYGMFKSTDGGAGWSPVNSGLPPFATGLPPFPGGSPYFQDYSVVIDPQQPDTVYAAITSFDSRVFKTTNGGASWSEASAGLPEGTLVSSLGIGLQISTTLYAGTRAGVFKSTDGGTSWVAANSGLTATFIADVAIDPRNSDTLYASTSNGLVKTTDGGTNWSPALAGIGSLLAIDFQNTTTVFASACAPAGSGVPSCGVFKSTDGGASWSASWLIPQDSYSNWITALAIDPQDSNIVYATTQGFDECDLETLHKSVDGGVNWSHSMFRDMGVSASCVIALAVDPQNSGNLYAAFQYGGVFKSTDAGATWSAANSGLALGTPRSIYNAVALAIDPGSPNTVYTVSSSGAFKSSDGGMSWNPANSGLPDWSSGLEDCCFRPRLAVDPQNPARVYLGIAVDGAEHVFQSSDGGANWIDSLVVSGSGLWSGGVAISSQGSSMVYAGTPAGVFRETVDGRAPSGTHPVETLHRPTRQAQ